jgi:glyoxylate utilization-related uncharacterized protein
MKVLFDEKGYVNSFTIDESGCFEDESNVVILPNPEDEAHFVEYYMHYNKDGFDQAHFEAAMAQKELEQAKAEVQVQIDELKAQLSTSDYKVIKCMEAQLAGEEMPYDIEAIHTERQAIRDKINELEQ